MNRPLLVRISWSHFCQKAEWALTQAGIEYDAVDIGLRGMLHAERICPSGLVPVMYLEDQILDGSQEILRWAEANAAPDTPPLRCADSSEWASWADEELGPATRRDAYRVLYKQPFAADVPFGIKLAARAGRSTLLSVLKHYKTRRFDASDAASLPAAVEKVAAGLDGQPFLLGESPTAADHAVAALMKPIRYTETARGLESVDGWGAVKEYLARVEPAKTTLQSKHWIREKDWKRLEAERKAMEGEMEEEKGIVA